MNFKNKLYLAPMAKITSSPFRILCKKQGADILVTEMVNANTITRNNKSTWKLTEHKKAENPIGIQLFGSRVDILYKAGKLVQNSFDFIDLNLGCPASKIIKQGAGSALLKRKNQIKKIIEKLSGLDKPITAKIRSGFKRKIIAPEIAQICENAGAKAIAIHARTMSQAYSGNADWNVIKEVKKSVSIPVIGNGDIFSEQDAKNIKKQTKCDSIMVGRAAIGNPFIFRDIKKGTKKVSIKQRINSLLSIAKDLDLKNFKMQALYFIKDFQGASKTRLKFSRIKTKENLIKELKKVI